MLRGLWHRPPDLLDTVRVLDRRGCDVAPVDATSDAGRLTLLSFVWPDQTHRFDRLRAALEVASNHPPTVDRLDAGTWLERELASPEAGTATVVHHSIVLQYLAAPASTGCVPRWSEPAPRPPTEAPLAWLRMEPAGRRADVRLTWWPGGTEDLLGTTGYHGHDIEWA